MATGAILNVRVLLLVLTVLLPLAGARAEGLAGEPLAEPHAAVWIEPPGTVLLGLTGIFYLPVGVNVPITQRLELVAEVTPLGYRAFGCTNNCQEYLGGYLALGALVHDGDLRLNGLFYQPKVVLAYFDETSVSQDLPTFKYPPQVEYTVGLDVGFQFTIGRWYSALVVGLRAGYATDLPLGFASEPLWGYHQGPRADGFFWGFNLNLLRLGYTL